MAEPGRIVIAGGSGFIGRALIELFTKAGDDVVVLSREGGKTPKGIRTMLWDGRTAGHWTRELEDAKAVVNLSGEPVACLWTVANRKKIIDSRVESTLAIGDAINKADKPPKVWLNTSAVGYYGNPGATQLTEEAGRGRDFLADVCFRWERAANNFETPETKRVILRMGQVLGQGGGILPPFVRQTEWFFGGRAGSGQQFVSWIHIRDLIRMARWTIENGKEGIYNATGPLPVTNASFMLSLRKVVGRPYCPPIPFWLIKLATQFIHIEAELAITGQNVIPKRALDEGFKFDFLNVDTALQNLV